MQKCNVAVDIGASSGRVIVGYLIDEHLYLEEIHRFDNDMLEKKGQLCWDIDRLFQEIKTGITLTVKANFQPISIGVDTWAVDFVLLDKDKNRITEAVCYRDHRTDGIMEQVHTKVDKKTLYTQTGIQFQPFNTIYQLVALQNQHPELIEKAHYFLMIPDYLHYLLTGTITNEYTNATTTQLVNASTQRWDQSLLQQLELPSHIFSEPSKPMQSIGLLKQSLQEEWQCQAQVILPGTHDTASAVLATLADDTIFISSGTWSLMGVEHDQPITTDEALTYNFTNEGGANERIRFLKNIMGLWMIQELKREYNDRYSFSDFVELAFQENAFTSVINVNDQRFLKPECMQVAIQQYCQETKQLIPQTVGQFAKCIFDSLVESYSQTAKEIEKITGKRYNAINIIGGGSKNRYMNEKLAEKSGKTLYTGPDEATAIGNLVAQMITTGQIASIEESKNIINKSFASQKFERRGEKA
ncbi:rhamnulokinase [Gracilibacillus sp. S3-1-1]|uniref:Rhamnulokinase n=1 Tax=Gracilibacillus pellucidus TaxID=3095368 RepID=A0ACC6M5S0_9BACI|nr:rhamnulokinase [Gracilibacillus sp. S3-1-1]MDX8046231.1 rhamnulokinase [Gracilibacillus sp. S3-1-1]